MMKPAIYDTKPCDRQSFERAIGISLGADMAPAAVVMKPGTELCRREDAERLFRQIIGKAETKA